MQSFRVVIINLKLNRCNHEFYIIHPSSYVLTFHLFSDFFACAIADHMAPLHNITHSHVNYS